MKIKLSLIVAAFGFSYAINAQSIRSGVKQNIAQIQNNGDPIAPHRTCGTQLPGADWDNWFNQKVEEFKQQKAQGKTQVLNYTIPVIVHVIHGGQPVGTYPNLAQGQINSQITVLNQDYSGTGYNVANLPSVFASAKANTGISFCLAQKDPNGNLLPEPGIDRINYVTKGWTNPTAAATTQTAFVNYITTVIKPGSIWDPTKYFNVWVTDANQSVALLGFATFPAGTSLTGLAGNFGTSTTDGVWCYSSAFGSNSIFPGGTYDAVFNKGRTLTHESGHWLGLRHIGGDGTCATDYCNDTPTQKGGFSNGILGQNYGCPTHPYVASGECSGTTAEMFMNFMDYTDDYCMYMFTNDQTTRMQTALTSGTYRSQLSASASTLCTLSAAAPTASFSVPATACTTSAISVINLSTGVPVPTYVWSSNPSTGVTFSPNNTATNPTINFTTPGNYSITVVATNSLGSNSNTKSLAITTCTTCIDTITTIPNTATITVVPVGTDTSTPGCSPATGYVTGSNCYDDLEKAEFFNSSLYSPILLPKVKSVIVLFFKYSTRGTTGNSATAVNLKLYNGTLAGGPTSTTTPFGQVNATIGNIVAVTATNSANYVGNPNIAYTNAIIRPYRYIFTNPVNAPTTNGFFASVTMPTAAGDTAVIMAATTANTNTPGTNWELWSDNTWHSISTAWGYNCNMAILPEIQCGVTGINKNSVLDANVSLHPNPTNGVVNIIATLPNAQALDISIHNSLGQLISTTSYNQVTNNVFTVDLTNYSGGVYFVTINNGEEKIVKRLILTK